MTDAEKKLRRNYANCFASGDGKAVLEDLERFCHATDQTHVFDQPDKSIFRAGERNVLLHIQRLKEPVTEKKQDTVIHKETEI